MNKTVLISGASVAGLTLASRLAYHGFEPTIVERSPRLRTGGNGVDVRGRAADVVRDLGIADAVQDAAAEVHGMKFVDAADRAVARIDTRDPNAVEIMRGDLVGLLHETARPRAEIVFGDTIRRLDEDGRGLTVSFERGAPRRFDLVIGADGTHSRVRDLAFGAAERFVVHRGHYFAFANAAPELGENRWMTIYNLPGKMAGIYRSGTHAQAKSYFVLRSPALAFDHRDAEQHRRLIREGFAGESSWHIPALLDSALGDPDFYVDALCQVRMPRWSEGRIALVGDAAWCASPASGAGAELALVGARRLADEFAAARGDHRLAFGRFESALRPQVRAKQRIGLNLRLMAPRTTVGRGIRNAFARLPLMSASGRR